MKLTRCDKWGLGIAAGLAIAVAACRGTGNLETVTHIFDQEAHVRLTWDEREVKAEQLPDGKRADVTFYDKDGNSVGTGATGVGQGEKVPIPADAKYVEFSGPSDAKSCTGCTNPNGSSGGASGGGGGVFGPSTDPAADSPLDAVALVPSPADGWSQRTPVASTEKWLHVYTLDADVTGGTAWANVVATFYLHARSDAPHADLHRRVAPLLFGGHGTPVPTGVDIGTFVRFVPETLGGRLYVADRTQAITGFEMHWNGSPYASLGSNALVHSAPNGWQVAEVFVPAVDFVVSSTGGSHNAIDLSWTTFEDTIPNSIVSEIAYW